MSDILNIALQKTVDALGEYLDYISHPQDIHPYSKQKERELFETMVYRYQDYDAIRYDPEETWELNFDDYLVSGEPEEKS